MRKEQITVIKIQQFLNSVDQTDNQEKTKNTFKNS